MHTKAEEINSGSLRFYHSYDRKVFRSHWQPGCFWHNMRDSFLPTSVETFIVRESITQGKGNEERYENTWPLCPHPTEVLFSFFLRPHSVEI